MNNRIISSAPFINLINTRAKWINHRSIEIQCDLGLPLGSRIIWVDWDTRRFQIEMPGAMVAPYFVPMTAEDIETEKNFRKGG